MTIALDDDFKLSRIEAQGWNMAQEYMSDQTGVPDEFRIAELNPYRADPARHRWAAGFTKAVTALYEKP
jgi:hypothetical protein